MVKLFATVFTFVALLSATAQAAAILKARGPGPVDCRDDLGAQALGNTADAVTCINQLAAQGSAPCTANQLSNILCQQGNTAITILNNQLNAQGGNDAGDTAFTCNDVAQAAGHILDICTRNDGTVRGSTLGFDNPNVTVDIRGL
ncbi:hypothetical protein HKX48_001637 [Thoreauomyces humboldtii]|nr:hypothetical protein HKX48_001637 [Thoreauomyces humboldtii]